MKKKRCKIEQTDKEELIFKIDKNYFREALISAFAELLFVEINRDKNFDITEGLSYEVVTYMKKNKHIEDLAKMQITRINEELSKKEFSELILSAIENQIAKRLFIDRTKESIYDEVKKTLGEQGK